MIDLDNFKGVNDRLGHLAGDALLAGLSERLRAQLRAERRAAFRYGGEEFSLVLPGVDASGGRTRSPSGCGAPWPKSASRCRPSTRCW